MIKAVIFDCFGVLIADPIKLFMEQADSHIAQRISNSIHKAHWGLLTSQGLYDELAENFDMSREDFDSWLYAGETKNGPLMKFIRKLSQNYKVVILSNVQKDGLDGRFNASEQAMFDLIVSSGKIGYAKPDRRAYIFVCNTLGISANECVFVDDKEIYCSAARDVGMYAIQYHDFAQFEREINRLLSDTIQA